MTRGQPATNSSCKFSWIVERLVKKLNSSRRGLPGSPRTKNGAGVGRLATNSLGNDVQFLAPPSQLQGDVLQICIVRMMAQVLHDFLELPGVRARLRATAAIELR